MTDDEKCALARDIVEPVNEVLGRMMVLIERLTERIAVLEGIDVLQLEQLAEVDVPHHVP
jgi:hypothetical protein